MTVVKPFNVIGRNEDEEVVSEDEGMEPEVTEEDDGQVLLLDQTLAPLS